MASRKRTARHPAQAAREQTKIAERFLVRLIWILGSEGPEATRAMLREAARIRRVRRGR